jgi:hypothetical protein
VAVSSTVVVWGRARRARTQGSRSMLPHTAVTGAISVRGVQNLGRADVAGVNDRVGAGQGLGAHLPVRIGDDPGHLHDRWVFHHETVPQWVLPR